MDAPELLQGPPGASPATLSPNLSPNLRALGEAGEPSPSPLPGGPAASSVGSEAEGSGG